MPIRWRLTLFNALAIGGILLLLGLALFFLIRGVLLSGLESDVRGDTEGVARTIEAGRTLGRAEARRLALDGVFVVVRDGEGRVLSQTVELPDEEHGGSGHPVWRRALEEGRPVSGLSEVAGEGGSYVYAIPVRPTDGAARVVEAGKSYEAVHETIETLGVLLAGGIGIAFLLSLIGAYVLARAALSPVEAVVRSAREITEGDLGRRLPVGNAKDEIGRLATTMNGLLSRLQAAFARREEALVRQEEALSRQRRFAADASHELRTPLTTIGGYARMLKDWGAGDPEAIRRAAEAIENESDRMREMVEDLLLLTRGDEGTPLTLVRGDLASVAGEAQEMARAAARGKVAIQYDAPDRPVEVVFDADRIRQVAAILLDNAVKYTPEGGRVTIAVREREGLAELEISDTGIGIPEDQLALIFERFYRADAARSHGHGAGLGLAIARQITEAH
ncbi:MAG TPA: ATP-binding protein, partial [Rubrobacter sp.]|nr:ATP-binding protein [Rubrobacter sp.]